MTALVGAGNAGAIELQGCLVRVPSRLVGGRAVSETWMDAGDSRTRLSFLGVVVQRTPR